MPPTLVASVRDLLLLLVSCIEIVPLANLETLSVETVIEVAPSDEELADVLTSPSRLLVKVTVAVSPAASAPPENEIVPPLALLSEVGGLLNAIVVIVMLFVRTFPLASVKTKVLSATSPALLPE